jgi:hypothetical protein
MPEDLFTNPHSQIPDELWKTSSPMERQLAAVGFWADLTHPEKTAAAKGLSTTTRLMDFFRTRKGNAALTAVGAATLTGGHALITGRKDEKGRTAAQRKLLEQDAAFSARDEMSGNPKKRRVHELKRRIVNAHAQHPALYPAGSAVLGGLIGGGLKYRLTKGKMP